MIENEVFLSLASALLAELSQPAVSKWLRTDLRAQILELVRVNSSANPTLHGEKCRSAALKGKNREMHQ
uniref:Transcriptional regulator n=1 Tax=Steinernema glaseri TaxID=37863 RepID=A0A1I8AD13_9BILA